MLQFPNNIQSYDRYQYCLNNPCTFTDPSGHFLPIIVAIILVAAKVGFWYSVAIMTITSVAWAAMNGAEGADLWEAGAMAIVSAGIGSVFGEVGNTASGMVDTGNVVTQEVARAAAHGITGGAASDIQGGKFANGAMTAAIQHLFNHEGGHRVKKGAVVWIANNQDGDAEIEGFLRDETDKLARDLNADLSFFAIHNDEEFARFNQISSRYDKVWVVMHGSLSYTRGNWSGGNAFVYERKFGRFGKSLKAVSGDDYGRTPTAQEIGINLKSSYAFGGVFGCNPIDTMTNSTPVFEVWEGKGVYQGVHIGIKQKITSFFNTGDQQ